MAAVANRLAEMEEETQVATANASVPEAIIVDHEEAEAATAIPS